MPIFFCYERCFVKNIYQHYDEIFVLNQIIFIRGIFTLLFILLFKYCFYNNFTLVHHMGTIGKNIGYLENRNGNSNVKFKQEETLQRVYDLLACKEIKIKRSRMDCGSFTKEVIKVVEENSELFYIRAQKCSELTSQIRRIENLQFAPS